MSFSDHNLSVVCRRCRCCCPCRIFQNINQTPISTKNSTIHPWVKNNQVCSIPRGENILAIFKILLQNYFTNFNKTWYNASLVKGIQVCSNEGPRPSPRGNYLEIAKIHWRKILGKRIVKFKWRSMPFSKGDN